MKSLTDCPSLKRASLYFLTIITHFFGWILLTKFWYWHWRKVSTSRNSIHSSRFVVLRKTVKIYIRYHRRIRHFKEILFHLNYIKLHDMNDIFRYILADVVFEFSLNSAFKYYTFPILVTSNRYFDIPS